MLGTKWGDCEIVYSYKDISFNNKYLSYIRKYSDIFPDNFSTNIWHDHITSSLFGSAMALSTKGVGPNHSFVGTRGAFFSKRWFGDGAWLKSHSDVLQNCFPNIPEVLGPDLRCGYNDCIKAIHNQDSVFIVGGGPSTAHVDFDRYKNIPKWTMNSFYKNETLRNLENIQLVTFLDDVNISDPELSEFLQKKMPLVIQEISDHGQPRIEKIKSFGCPTTWMLTRYRSKLGVGARLVVFAILMGIKNIYISGLDGYDFNSDNTHVFEKGKKIPGWMKPPRHLWERADTLGNSMQSAGTAIQRQQFVVFWDYILNDLRRTREFKIHDLSKGQNTVQYNFIQDYIN